MRKLKWATFSGGTGAAIDRRTGFAKHGYSSNTELGEYHIDPPSTGLRWKQGYIVRFANTKSVLIGGLWQTIADNVRRPDSAKRIAQEHYNRIWHQLESVSGSRWGDLR